MQRLRIATSLLLLPLLLAVAAGVARAQSATEPKDPTRLDVERLPPEAITLQRDMFASGPYLEARLGGRGWVGGLGKLVAPGLLSRVGVGYELLDYLGIGVAFELSLHDSNAPAPPVPTALQVISSVAELRLRVPLSVRFALQLGAEIGVVTILGNGLDSYGLQDAHGLGVLYGGGLGFDWHLLSPHHSLGLLVGARGAPSLDDPAGDPTLEIGSSLYLRYVF